MADKYANSLATYPGEERLTLSPLFCMTHLSQQTHASAVTYKEEMTVHCTVNRCMMLLCATENTLKFYYIYSIIDG